MKCFPCRSHHHSLEFTSFGKPHPSVFKNAEIVLQQLVPPLHEDPYNNAQSFKTLYIIGDNPAVDIRGARQTGHPWFSILMRTGVFKGKGNHDKFPADLNWQSLGTHAWLLYKPMMLQLKALKS